MLYLHFEMKRLLKYLIPVIMAAIFWNCADNPASAVPEDVSAGLSVMASACQTGISSADMEFCLPSQVSFANSQRVQSAPRRTASTHRNGLEFAKSGKVFNACLKYSVQRRSIIVHSSMIEPSHRLLSLGKLII